jgi:hypothetical protein
MRCLDDRITVLLVEVVHGGRKKLYLATISSMDTPRLQVRISQSRVGSECVISEPGYTVVQGPGSRRSKYGLRTRRSNPPPVVDRDRKPRL